MTNKQPEALRLAECLDEPDYCTILQMRQAAAELRRLHEVNARLIHISRRIRFEQGFACECGIEEATWDLIDAALGEINDGN